MDADVPNPLSRFGKETTVLLTTFRRDGRPVGTPVSIAVVGDHAVFRTYDKAWKTRRLAHTSRVTIALCTASGKPTGPAIEATARLVSGAEARDAAHALRRKHPILHGVLVPLTHRLRRHVTLHYRVDVPTADHEGDREPLPSLRTADLMRI